MRKHPIAEFMERHRPALSQAEAARRLRISQQDVSAYIHWKQVPRTKTLTRLAAALGVSRDAFLPDVPGRRGAAA